MAYISEVDFYGDDANEFIEIAVPTGTDVSGYSLQVYQGDGSLLYTFGVGTYQSTVNGQDVYVLDASDPAFNSGGDSTGVLYPDDGLALVDGSGTVLQFVSWTGNTVSATNGDASGLTSTNIGTPNSMNDSMQSDDGGATYYSQATPNAGTIPACYARGTLIRTLRGDVRIENLDLTDRAVTADGKMVPIRWIWSGTQPLGPDSSAAPVRFRAGCFAPNVPTRNLVVSAQHRIAVGQHQQVPALAPALVPAKAMTQLPGTHVMSRQGQIQWWHIICDRHCLIVANGVVSETMLLGPQTYRSFSHSERRALRAALPLDAGAFWAQQPALQCLSVQQARRALSRDRAPA